MPFLHFQLPLRDSQLLKPANSSEGVLWLGSPWTCRKMRRHYLSFQRHGVKISVFDFVYVLSEDNKRLVAYIEDMYEDSRGNKMVVVRWFHKVDEVGLVLSRTFSDRDIFFSLCLQDINVECIDGMATVLSPHHFEKYMNDVGSSQMEPFVCHELFDDDEIKPFDITLVKGYWNQQLLKHIFPFLPPKPHLKPRPCEPSEEVKQKADQDSIGIRPRKKQRLLQPNSADELCNLNEGSAADRSKKLIKENPPLLLSVGCAVEVLSQDSGIRGCWFRASIIRVSKDKVKVRYQDIIDIIDEENQLEEWISASKLAASDEFGLRFDGRRTIRPLRSNEDKCLHAIGVGTVVDAWWYDGWWEGIVVWEEHQDRFRVFFPGEKRESVFPLKALRHSQEWIGNRWVPLKERPEVVTSMVHLLQRKHVGEANCGNDEMGLEKPHSDTKDAIINELRADRDFSKDICPANWKWSSGKRTYRRRKVFLKEYEENEKASLQDMEKCALDEFLTCPSFKVDREKCKLISDPLFNCSVVPPLSNLVMSR